MWFSNAVSSSWIPNDVHVSSTTEDLKKRIAFIEDGIRDICFGIFQRVIVRGIFGIRINATILPETFPEGSFIIASNHQSHLDTVAILAALPKDIRKRTRVAAARDHFFTHKKFAWACWLFRLIPVDRAGCGIGLFHNFRSLAKAGECLVLFPEGTRTRTGETRSFKTGAAKIALMYDVPVIPVTVDGAFDLMPHDRIIPHRGKISITIHHPIESSGLDADELMQSVEDVVRNNF